MSMKLGGENGFTIVELAVVLVAVGILIGLGMGIVGPLIDGAKTRECREIMGGALESVNSYASGNNRIPDAALFSTTVSSADDAWGRPLIYLFDNNLFTPATKDTICGRKTTVISATDTVTGATVANVAYMVVSPGDDGIVNTNIGGTPVTSGGRNVATAVTADTANDLVRWVTVDELRTKVGCQGAQLKIVNNEFPYGTVNSPYPSVGGSISITVDGGATPASLRWCVEAPTLAPLPSGIVFTPSLAGAVRVAPNTCTGATPLAEAGWISSPTLTLSGTPVSGAQGSYNFKLYVRDNNDNIGANDNISSKSFVLTINP